MPTTFRSSSIPTGQERRLLERCGYACEVCGVPVVADPDRRIERIDQARGDTDSNSRLVCGACAEVDRPASCPAGGGSR